MHIESPSIAKTVSRSGIQFSLSLPALTVLAFGLAACGGDDSAPEASPTTVILPTATQPPATAAPSPVATATPESEVKDEKEAEQPPTPEPTATKQPVQTDIPSVTEAPPTPEPVATSDAEKLAAYAAEYANGPGAIFIGDPSHLIGPPPHEGLMFSMPEGAYQQVSGLGLQGSEALGVPSHLFIYTSDYYKGLIEKADLTDPTELVSSGENIEIQHVCLGRNLPPCVLIQAYLAPNLARRTNGQVQISVVSLVELAIAGPDTLTQVSDGTLDMVNIFTGYVAGEVPSLEVQSLWGSAPDWETSYPTLTALADDVDRLIEDATGGSQVFNRNWFAGSDQWFFSDAPLQTVADYEDLKIRSNSASMSDFIRGMGGQAEFTSIAELYTSLDQGIVDAAVYGALLAVSARLHETTDYMSGPIIGFGYTNNVINKDVWNSIPSDCSKS